MRFAVPAGFRRATRWLIVMVAALSLSACAVSPSGPQDDPGRGDSLSPAAFPRLWDCVRSGIASGRISDQSGTTMRAEDVEIVAASPLGLTVRVRELWPGLGAAIATRTATCSGQGEAIGGPMVEYYISRPLGRCVVIRGRDAGLWDGAITCVPTQTPAP